MSRKDRKLSLDDTYEIDRSSVTTVQLCLHVSILRRPSSVYVMAVSPSVRQHYAFSSQFLGVHARVHMLRGFNCT